MALEVLRGCGEGGSRSFSPFHTSLQLLQSKFYQDKLSRRENVENLNGKTNFNILTQSPWGV